MMSVENMCPDNACAKYQLDITDEKSDSNDINLTTKNMLHVYQHYLDDTEYKDLPPQLNVLSDTFYISDDVSEIYNSYNDKNIIKYDYFNFWDYLDLSITQKILSPTNWFCKFVCVDDNIFIEVYERIVDASEPAIWLKARISLKTINGTVVKHGVQEMWHEIPILKDCGYHTINSDTSSKTNQDGNNTYYKLVVSPQAYKSTYNMGIKHGPQFVCNMNYKSHTIEMTEITQFQNGNIRRRQSWYPSGKQKSHKFIVNNVITKEENVVTKDWTEDGHILHLSYTTLNTVRYLKYNIEGLVIQDSIKNVKG